MKEPLISILCPVLNEADNIQNLVQSFSLDNLEKEIFFIDGGSTDNSKEIIEKVRKKKHL